MRYLLPLLLLCFFRVEAVQYPLTNDPIDVVIPCHQKDLPMLELCIEGIRKNGENIGNVYVISKKRLTDKAEWVDESIFPFTKAEVNKRVIGEVKFSKLINKYFRNWAGWVYQQLLKLYAPIVLPTLSPNVLILDADTIFLNPVSFLTPEGNPLMNYYPEMETAYFKFVKKFLPGVQDTRPPSGITHHMVFQRLVIEDLFSVVEAHHQAPFWEAFCDCAHFTDPLTRKNILPTEYGVYGYFISSRSDQLQLRQLKWANMPDPAKIPEYRKNGFHYVSLHSYMREKHKIKELLKNTFL
jgi:Family of unknown function (DUF6492)